MKNVVLAVDPLDYEIRGLYRFASLKPSCTLAQEVGEAWPENPRLLMIASDPADATFTENLALDLASALSKADLPVGEVRVLQEDTASVAVPLIAGADVIVLANDHDDTRPGFFADIDLAEALKGAKDDALLIALSEEALKAAGLEVS